MDPGRRVHGKADVKQIEGEEHEEVQREQEPHRRQRQDRGERRFRRGRQPNAMLVIRAEDLAYADFLRVGPQGARVGFREPEGDHEAGYRRDEEGGEDGQRLSQCHGAERAGNRRAQNISKVRRHRHLAEVGAAIAVVADVCEVGIGDRHAAASGPVQRPGEKKHQKRQRERESAEQWGMHFEQGPDWKPERSEENSPGDQSPDLGQQQDTPPPVAIRPTPQHRRAQQLEEGIGRPHDPIDERVPAELGDQIDQKRQHDAETERTDEVDRQDREDRHTVGWPRLDCLRWLHPIRLIRGACRFL